MASRINSITYLAASISVFVAEFLACLRATCLLLALALLYTLGQ